MANAMTLQVGIYLYDEVEVLDFAGPFEVFSTASRANARLNPDLPPPFQVFTLSSSHGLITARGGLVITPQYDLTDHPALDVMLIPGGVVTKELENRRLIDWIGKTSPQTKITASVCTGAFLLASAGLLDGLPATTHWDDMDDLQTKFPRVKVLSKKRWIDNGRIVTSAGISAGIDMSLHLVARLECELLAVQTAHQMEYSWDPGRVDQ